MKVLSVFFTAISISLLSVSCLNTNKTEALETDDFNTVPIGGLYEIDVPKYMKVATDLNFEASLQYQNAYKETYIVIIDEDKQDFVDVFRQMGAYDESISVVENYGKVQAQSFIDAASTVNYRSSPGSMIINNMPAQQVEFHGRVPEVPHDIGYLLTFVEGNDDLYMIMTWTMQDDMDKYRPTFEHMANSFREL